MSPFMTIPSRGHCPDWMGLDEMVAQGSIKLARAPCFLRHHFLLTSSERCQIQSIPIYASAELYVSGPQILVLRRHVVSVKILPKSDTLFLWHRNRESFGMFHPIRVCWDMKLVFLWFSKLDSSGYCCLKINKTFKMCWQSGRVVLCYIPQGARNKCSSSTFSLFLRM